MGVRVIFVIGGDIERFWYLGVLGRLLLDKSTQKNIMWATDAYLELGREYGRNEEIFPHLITGANADVIRTRACKELEQQSQRTRKRAEVFTPLWVCRFMNDKADEEWFGYPDVFFKGGEPCDEVRFFEKKHSWQHYVDSRRLEITCGEAPYLMSRYDVATGEPIPIEKRCGILDRKLRVVGENTASEAEWFKWAVRALQATYGYDFQGDNVLIARINILCTFEDHLFKRWGRKLTKKEIEKLINIITWNIWQMDGLTYTIPFRKAQAEFEQLSLFSDFTEKVTEEQPLCRVYDWRKGRSGTFIGIKEGENNMQFDFIIGNPPYQNETIGDSNTATPIYHTFLDASFDLSNKVMLITPARFLYNAGYTPKVWNQKMLNDEHLKVVFYEQDSSKVFSGVDIKGGLVILYHDMDKEFGAIRIFTKYPEISTILNKVLNFNSFKSLNKIIVTSFAYHYTNILYEENSVLNGRASKGHDFDIQSNAFTKYHEVFFDNAPDEDEYIRILGRDGNKRKWKYIKRKYVTNVSNLDLYKVFYSKATGTGQFGEVMPEAIIGNPADGATVSYFSIGNFSTKSYAYNCVKYVKTKFARALLSVLKVTQDNTPAKWKYVPLQDFTSDSDIDWSKSVAEIDRQLYAKYGLDENEIEFIETHVKEME